MSKKVLFIFLFLIMSSFIFNIKVFSQQNNFIPFLFPFENKAIHKSGYIDNLGKIAMLPQFDQAFPFTGEIAVFRVGNLYGFVNSEGKIINAKFHGIRAFTEGMVLVQIRTKWGYVDKNGFVVIPPLFNDAYSFYDGLAKVLVGKKYGYIDTSGNYVVLPKFDYADNFSDNVAQASFEFKDTTYINKTGKTIFRAKNDFIYNYSEGVAPMLVNNKYGYIDKKGKTYIAPQFEEVRSFHDGLAFVKRNGKWGLINLKSRYIISPVFEAVREFNNELAAVKINNKWGFINKSGNFVIEPVYNAVRDFSENIAAIKFEDRWGFIDSTGKIIIKPLFDSTNDFSGNLALVNDNSYIDKTGNYVWSPSIYAEEIGKLRALKLSSSQEQIYHLQKEQKVCVNHWGQGLGFCGIISNVTETNYIINVKQVNCGNIRCMGACSNKFINDIVNTGKNNSFMSQGLYLVDIPKDCITYIF